MKLKQDLYRNDTDFTGKTFDARLNMDRLSLVIENLAKNYNHPEMAILREWVSNAHDSHVEAGQTRPVEVTLPTEFNPTFMVRDYGVGMTLDEFENVYAVFGGTTKDDSNNVIGGYGIGGKSALAIASQYTVLTVKNGLKNVFILERSPKGGVQIKTVIENEPTEEPNGLTATVSVERIDQFNMDTVSRVLAGWSNEHVLINEGNDTFYSLVDNSFKVPGGRISNGAFESRAIQSKSSSYRVNYEVNKDINDFYHLISPNSRSWGSQENVAVSIGPVMYYYEIDRRRLAETKLDESLLKFIVLDIPIGSVTFPSSREVIEPTRANTDVIMKALEEVATPLRNEMERRVEAAESEKDVLDLYSSTAANFIEESVDFYGEISYSFKGEEIPARIRLDTARDGYYFKKTGQTWRQNKNYQISSISNKANYKFSENVDARQVQYLIKCEKDTSLQSLRNLFRKYVAQKNIHIDELEGYLAFDPSPSRWTRAAVKEIITEQELRDVAKLFSGSTFNKSTTSRVDKAREYSVSVRALTQRNKRYTEETVDHKTWGDFLDDPDFDVEKPILFANYNETLNSREIAIMVDMGILSKDDVYMLDFQTTAKEKTLLLANPHVKFATISEIAAMAVEKLTVDPRIEMNKRALSAGFVLDNRRDKSFIDEIKLRDDVDTRFFELIRDKSDKHDMDDYAAGFIRMALNNKFGKFEGVLTPVTHDELKVISILSQSSFSNKETYNKTLVKHINFAVMNYFAAIENPEVSEIVENSKGKTED